MYKDMYLMLKGQVSTELELVDPEKAKEYLSHNTNNARTPSKTSVSAYASDIKSMNWEFTGETVAFRKNGTLYNGQHRLLAIIQSGIAVPLLIVRGVPDENNIADWGKTRSISSWGKSEGLAVSNSLQGLVRMIISMNSIAACPKGRQARYISDHYEKLREAEKLATTGKHDSLGRRSPMCLAVYVARELKLVNDSIIENFFRVFNTGTVLPEEARDPSAPLTAARQIMTQYGTRYAGGHVQFEQYNIVIQAMLDYKANKNRRQSYKLKDVPNALLDNLRSMDKVTEEAE